MDKSAAFFTAASSNLLSAVKDLSNDPDVNINCQTAHPDSLTPLHIACEKGHLQVVKFLLGLPGIQPDLPATEGITPFWVACEGGHVDVVSALLSDPRIDVNQPKRNGATPFFMACLHAHVDVISLLLGDKRVEIGRSTVGGTTPFLTACEGGRLEVISLLLADDRIDVNQSTATGITALSCACQTGRADVVALLLADQRADPNQPRDFGMSPLFIASENGHVEVVSVLLGDKRVDVNQVTDGNCTPLWVASQNGHLSVVQHLLATQRRVDTRTRALFNNLTAGGQARALGRRTVGSEGESEEDFRRRKANCPEIAKWIKEYRADPGAVRWQLMKVLGEDERLAGELFALVVYLSDGHLKVPSGASSSESRKKTKALRFFSLALQLPMDLQVVLCNRAFGLSGSIVKRTHSERGFKKFAKGF